MTRSRLDALILEQEQIDTLDRESIEAIQLKKLNRLLAQEKKRGGFYRNLPEKLNSLQELETLPFTTEEDLAGNAPGLLLTSQSEIRRVLSDATSGTTGRAKRVFYTEGDLENTIRLYMAGLGELIFPGSITMICFPFSGPYGLGELISEAVTRLGARSLKLGSGLRYGEYREILEREKPDTFVGMPVQLFSILQVCGRGSLRRALVSGDAMPESVEKGIEKILGSKLFPHYGSREMGMAGAVTCPAHEGMHLRENMVIAEIIDPEGHVLPKGAYGELVITTVGMEAMPLIRYRTGDRTRILPDPCPCGSAAIRLDRLHRLEGGAEISALDDAVFSVDGVVDACYFRSDEQMELQVKTAASEDAEKITARLRELLPYETITIHASPAYMNDRALIAGKRSL